MKDEIKAKENIMTIIKRGLLLVAILVGLGLTGSQAAWAKKDKEPKQVDPTTIAPCTSATTTLNLNNVVYTLKTSFSTTFTGTCISLTGNNDLLVIGPEVTITGPGDSVTGSIGISITGNTDVINGRASTISDFGVGVLDNGNSTLGDNMTFTTNGTGLELGSSGHTPRWVNVNSTSNTGSGVWINGCGDDCQVSNFFSASNGGDGVLINNGAGPGSMVSIFVSQDNTGNGVHIGNTSGGGTNASIVDDAALSSTLAINNNGKDGVFLDTSESGAQDVVTGVESDDNTGIDMQDATANCGTMKFNLWSSNTFSTSKAGTTTNPTCIPLLPNE
jgi:hypothetical protein